MQKYSREKTLFGVLFLLYCCYLFSSQSNQYQFNHEEQEQALILRNYQGRFRPRITDNYLELINGGRATNHNNAVIFPDLINNEAAIEVFIFSLYLTKGAKGAGLALVAKSLTQDDSLSFKAESWEMPNFPGALGLGINVYNPPTSHWFNEFGNYYSRPEREISIHWDNQEKIRVLSPVEFRSDEHLSRAYKFILTVHYLTGGAVVNVAIEDTLVINDFFIAEMKQYEKQPVFGGSTTELTCSIGLTEFSFQTSGVCSRYHLLETQALLSNEIFHSANQRPEYFITFPLNTNQADQVILTLDLSGPPGGVSDWDVTGTIYLVDEKETQFEILRYITPYRRPYVWKVDVTHFLPLFIGTKKIIGRLDTWEPVADDQQQQVGWKVTAKLDFYQTLEKEKSGTVPNHQNNSQETELLIIRDLKPFLVQNLWSGSFEYGNPEYPQKGMLKDYHIEIPRGAKTALLRITTSGHGMYPNSDNAAEFRPAERWIYINGDEYYNLLWKTDNYLNPCRPQDGTWKFDRAGWAPGSIVHSWNINLEKYILQDQIINISYQPDDYINNHKGETWDPFHIIETQIIFYQ